MMASSLLKINFDDFTDAIPAFLTFILMPLSYSVADGIMLGIISYTIIKVLSNKRKEVNLTLMILSVLFILKFIFL
jgi:AGZA family xanthine/uracil permease-like MFS transporter